MERALHCQDNIIPWCTKSLCYDTACVKLCYSLYCGRSMSGTLGATREESAKSAGRLKWEHIVDTGRDLYSLSFLNPDGRPTDG